MGRIPKVGDTVRIVKAVYSCDSEWVGTVGMIKEVKRSHDDIYSIYLKETGSTRWIERECELVTNNEVYVPISLVKGRLSGIFSIKVEDTIMDALDSL